MEEKGGGFTGFKRRLVYLLSSALLIGATSVLSVKYAPRLKQFYYTYIVSDVAPGENSPEDINAWYLEDIIMNKEHRKFITNMDTGEEYELFKGIHLGDLSHRIEGVKEGIVKDFSSSEEKIDKFISFLREEGLYAVEEKKVDEKKDEVAELYSRNGELIDDFFSWLNTGPSEIPWSGKNIETILEYLKVFSEPEKVKEVNEKLTWKGFDLDALLLGQDIEEIKRVGLVYGDEQKGGVSVSGKVSYSGSKKLNVVLLLRKYDFYDDLEKETVYATSIKGEKPFFFDGVDRGDYLFLGVLDLPKSKGGNRVVVKRIRIRKRNYKLNIQFEEGAKKILQDIKSLYLYTKYESEHTKT